MREANSVRCVQSFDWYHILWLLHNASPEVQCCVHLLCTYDSVLLKERIFAYSNFVCVCILEGLILSTVLIHGRSV